MKDLYRRNRLRPRERDIVRIHGAAGSGEEREAAFGILLNARRKKDYDAAHLALSRIGYLRRQIGLAGQDNWRKVYGDFLDPDVMLQNVATEATTPSRRPWVRLLGWLMIVTVIVAVLLPLAWLALRSLENLA